MTPLVIELPDEAMKHLEQMAKDGQQTVTEIAKQLLLRELPALPPLPDEVEAELAAFAHLSDDALWVLAQSTLSAPNQTELDMLNDKAQREELLEEERQRQAIIGAAYDRALIRRARVIELLHNRSIH